MKQSAVRCNEEDRKLILAIAKAGFKMPISDMKINTSSRVIRMLLEQWVNSDPEINIQALYRGKYTLNVPGYSVQWDHENIEGEQPKYIQLSKYIQKSSIEEVRLIRDTRTGEIRFQSVGNPDDYFIGEIPDVNDVDEEDDEETEEDIRVYPYRNIETGIVRYGNTGITIGEEYLKVLFNRETGKTREVLRSAYCEDNEEEIDLYMDSLGELYYNECDEETLDLQPALSKSSQRSDGQPV